MTSYLKKIITTTFSLLVGVILISGSPLVKAAGGDLDTLFASGTGTNAAVYSVVVQPDGKILIGGQLTTYNGTPRSHIARLNVDGSLDTTFDPGAGANSHVETIALQPDGKIIIGGEFTAFNGTSRTRIARLNSDGSLDTTFDPGTGATGSVVATAVQPDGKIIIGGGFVQYNGTSRRYIARLNTDGSLDTSFNPGTGADGILRTTTVQSDGKILIGGDFTTYNGTARNCIARLNTDGSLDTTFSPSINGNFYGAYTILVQPDGKIIVGGSGANSNSIPFDIMRFNADGSVDSTFHPGASSFVYTAALQTDGKIIIGGTFSSYNNTLRNSIARLNSDGSLDTAFNPGSGANWDVHTLAIQPSGKIIIGGIFTRYNNTPCGQIARLLSDPGTISFSAANYSVNEADGSATITLTRTGGTDNKVVAKVTLTDVTTSAADHGMTPGTVDTIFNSVPGFTSATGTNNTVSPLALQPDGKILIGGAFTVCRGVTRNHIARLNPDGTLDMAFDPAFDTNAGVVSIIVQPDGYIIVGGTFFVANGAPLKHLRRLKPDGTEDTTFNPITAVNSSPSVALQADGKILVGGDFSDGGITQPRILRLNSDGSLDPTFNTGAGANNSVGRMTVQPDGKILVSGSFTVYNGVARNHLARLNTDGSVDLTFNPVADVNDYFYAVLLQPDGKILTGGEFTDFNGFHGVLRRLNSDGTLDTSFNAGTGPNLPVYTAGLQPDGKIVIAGNFTTYNGTSRTRIARLSSDGSLDTGFNPGTGADNPILKVIVQEDGRLLIGGDFTNYNNAYRSHIARVEGDIFVSWPAGDSSTKTLSLPIIDDSILEPSESLTLSLTPIIGGATVGNSPTATLTIVDNDTSVSVVSGNGVYNGTATLTATLSAFSSKLSGRTISFTRFGFPAGTAITDSNGVATLSGVNISGFNAGTYTVGVRASFGGETDYSSSSNTGALTIIKATPVITWQNPANIASVTPLSDTQLNATANVPGTFQYNPPAGTVLNVGVSQLSVTFTPTDTTNYNSTTKSVQITVEAAPPAVSFSSSTYTVGEAAGNIAVTVSRTDTSAAASVDYATSDPSGLTACNQVSGNASSRCDYATTVGTLRFAAGESTKTIFIPIVDDGYVEGAESFIVKLSNPGAVSLGATTTATVTITDNDSATSNPIVGVPFFVRQQYIDFLGREPDAGGFAGWQNILNNCTAGDTSCDRIAVSSGFFRSPEFQDRGSFIFRFYSAALGRNPSYSEFMPDLAKVSGFLSDAQLEANKVAFVQEFMGRTEFTTKYGALSNAAFVDALIQTAGLASHPLRGAWIDVLNNGTATKAEVLRAFTESKEVYDKFYNQVFVVMQYFGYLRRDPDASYLTWIQIMNSNGGDYRGMISGFMNSNEYVLRFGP